MLHGPMTHPGLIGALAAAGHGSLVLLADGNYPHSTGVPPQARTVHLNLRPGLLDVDQVLEVVGATIPVEAATVMSPGGDEAVPAHREYRRALGSDVEWRELTRFDFYDACRSSDLAVLVATGDQRLYANLLLTVGVRSPED